MKTTKKKKSIRDTETMLLGVNLKSREGNRIPTNIKLKVWLIVGLHLIREKQT